MTRSDKQNVIDHVPMMKWLAMTARSVLAEGTGRVYRVCTVTTGHVMSIQVYSSNVGFSLSRIFFAC